MIGQFIDTMIVALKSGYNNPSNVKSWKVLETDTIHLKICH